MFPPSEKVSEIFAFQSVFGMKLETLKSRGFLREKEDTFSVGSTEHDSPGPLEPTPSCHSCRHKSKIGTDKLIIS